MESIGIPSLSAEPSGADLPPPPADDIAPDLPPKRQRKRKIQPEPEKKAEPIEVSADELNAINQAIGMGIRVLFDIVAAKRGEHWKIQEAEQKALGESWGVALAPWIAQGAKYVPLATAALITAGVVVPRLQQDAERVAALTPREIAPATEIKPNDS